MTVELLLMASDKFYCDYDDVLAEVIADWSAPEINYPLMLENVQRFLAWLTQEEPYLSKPNLDASNFGGISFQS